MATIDLSTPAPAPEGILEGLPRRLALTLPELQLLAAKGGGAPLPFELASDNSDGNSFESRLGKSRSSTEDGAYAAGLDTLRDPAESLTRRGLLDGDTADAGVIGALGLLATPTTAVDIDLNVGGVRARAWHRQRDDAVATLATTDGLVFELAWFESPHWPAELARVAVLPEDQATGESRVGTVVDLPYELLDAGGEAVRSGRNDLLGTIVAHHSGTTRDESGEVLADNEVAALISALVGETEGRLRAMVAGIGADSEAGGNVVGVVSWVLLADGWRSIRTRQEDGVNRVKVRRVTASELASDLGPVLAEVSA